MNLQSIYSPPQKKTLTYMVSRSFLSHGMFQWLNSNCGFHLCGMLPFLQQLVKVFQFQQIMFQCDEQKLLSAEVWRAPSRSGPQASPMTHFLSTLRWTFTFVETIFLQIALTAKLKYNSICLVSIKIKSTSCFWINQPMLAMFAFYLMLVFSRDQRGAQTTQTSNKLIGSLLILCPSLAETFSTNCQHFNGKILLSCSHTGGEKICRGQRMFDRLVTNKWSSQIISHASYHPSSVLFLSVVSFRTYRKFTQINTQSDFILIYRLNLGRFKHNLIQINSNFQFVSTLLLERNCLVDNYNSMGLQIPASILFPVGKFF